VPAEQLGCVFGRGGKGIPKRSGNEKKFSFPHGLATDTALADDACIRTVQELLGHRDVNTTTIYTQVLNRGRPALAGPSTHSEPIVEVLCRSV